MADLSAGGLTGQVTFRLRGLDEYGLRIAYVPAEGDEGGIGELYTNHVTETRPHLHQLSPFEPWYPSPRTNTASPIPSGPPWRTMRSQRNWLGKFHPEARAGWGSFMDHLLSEGLDALKGQEGEPLSTQLLAVGEISDRRMPDLKSCHVVAAAWGEHGHILRIIRLQQEPRAWAGQDPKMHVQLDTPNMREEGQWSDDLEAIRNIKFYTDTEGQRSIRWVVVQKEHSTTICEPEIRKLGVGDGMGQPSLRIAINPICTITPKDTGNHAHCDVSIGPSTDGTQARVAIVDQSGHWSVWDIIRHRSHHARPRHTFLRVRGAPTTTSTMQTLGTAAGVEDRHWVSLLPRDVYGGPGKVQSQGLLWCNGTTLKLFDVNNREVQKSLELLVPKKACRVLDVQPSPLDPGHVFILTNTAVYLMAVGSASAAQDALRILAWCPHLRDKSDQTLNMALGYHTDSAGHKACFACLQSPRDSLLTTIWFMPHAEAGSVHCYRENISLDTTEAGGVALVVLPAQRNIPADSVSGFARSVTTTDFMQLLVLGPNFEVDSSLCAVSDCQKDVPLPYVRLRGKKSNRERKRFFRDLEHAFLAPDGFDETVALDARPQEQNQGPIPRRSSRLRQRRKMKITEDQPPSSGRENEATQEVPPPSSAPDAAGNSVSRLGFLEGATIERARGWDLGGDATQLHWTSREGQRNMEDAARLKRKQETRRRKLEQRKASLWVPTSSQPPRVDDTFVSSQPQFLGISSQGRSQSNSQSMGRDTLFSQPMSQVVPGPFGGRVRVKKKKIRKEVTGGFR